ncbi:MFS transporter [Candidatus Kurthia intestinigallinarum]|uniref:MFS transporter n=1 Tax=Candidatus Kurthia intestinigallinarum TaxID=1562256 RepID=UPI000F8C5C7B
MKKGFLLRRDTVRGFNPLIWLVLSNLLIVFLGIGLIVPVMPTLMNEMGLSGATMGYLMSAFSITQLIFSPLAGRWIDRYGRKKLIVIGMIIFGFSELLFAVGTHVGVLYAARFIGGISAAFIMPAVTAYVADITTIEQRSKAMGLVSAVINTGFILGPGIGGFLAQIDTRMPFYVAAALGFVGAVGSLFALKESNYVASEKQANGNTQQWKKLLLPSFAIPFIVIFISSFGLATYETVYGLFLDHQLNYSAGDIATLLTVSGIVGAVFQLFLFDGLTRKMGEINLIRVSMLIAALFMIFMIKSNSYAVIFFVTIVVFLTFDLIRPALTTYLSKIAGNEQGFVGGMNSMFTSIGNIAGPAIAGILFDMEVHLPYYFAMIVLGLSFIITLAWKKPKEL